LNPIDARRRPLVVGAYYLHDRTAHALLHGEDPHPLLDEIFDVARRAGAFAVRALACHVGHDEAAIQSAPDRMNALGLEALDVVVRRAHRAQVQLILSLGNAWDDYGGARAIAAMVGHADAKQSDLRFFVSPRARAAFRFGMRAVLERPIDGWTLATHPAIAAWEPMNEPRTRGLDRGGVAMRWWLDSVTRELRALSPGKPISSGEEGLDRTLVHRSRWFWRLARASHLFRRCQSFAANATLPSVDHPSVHLYPQAWGVPARLVGEAGERFIRESAALCRGKPLLVGEMGAHGPNALEHLARWTHVTWSVGGIAGIWMLASPRAPRHRDPYALDPEDFVGWARRTRP